MEVKSFFFFFSYQALIPLKNEILRLVMNSKKQTERQTTYKQFNKSKNDFLPKFLFSGTNRVTLNGHQHISSMQQNGLILNVSKTANVSFLTHKKSNL